MKKCINRFVLLFTLNLLAVTMYGQSKADIQAIALYNKAENSYNSAAYEEALDYLKQAETLLGSSNSKLLYLKIETLNLLAKVDSKRVLELQRAIAQFFQVTDQGTYPADKYMNVTTIELDIKSQIAKEDAAYQKVKASNNVADYQTFFNDFPGSTHEAELKMKYNQLLAQQKRAEQQAADKKWNDENLPLIKKYHSKGVACATTGSILLTAGLAGIGYATYDFTIGVRSVTSRDYTAVANGGNGVQWSNQIIKYRYPGKYYGNNWLTDIIVWSVGGTAFISGLVLTPVGVHRLKKAKKIRQDASNHNVTVSVSPLLNPVANSYACNVTFKF